MGQLQDTTALFEGVKVFAHIVIYPWPLSCLRINHTVYLFLVVASWYTLRIAVFIYYILALLDKRIAYI